MDYPFDNQYRRKAENADEKQILPTPNFLLGFSMLDINRRIGTSTSDSKRG
jgi:hypothetical protein